MAATRNDIVISSYSATWNALAVGNVAKGGFKKRYNYSRRDVLFDAVGDTPVDMLFTGLNMFVDFGVMQYNKEAIATMTWPWDVIRGTVPNAGKSLWLMAKPFVLTACDADANPTSITFIKTIIAPDFDTIHNYSGTEERMIPMRLIVLPVKYNSGGYTTPERPIPCEKVTYFTEVVPAIT
jgi:hypothetical protein